MLCYYVPALHNTMIGSDVVVIIYFFIEKVPLCTDPFNCFMFVLNIGMRAGGGVGDAII